MTIERDALVCAGLPSPHATGWAEAAKKIAEAGDDTLTMGEFGDSADQDLSW